VSVKANLCKNTLTGSVAFKKLRHRQGIDSDQDKDNNILNKTEINSEINELNFTEVKPQLAMQVFLY
jgi:hypothetical protein